jgi:hypothetical protein
MTMRLAIPMLALLAIASEGSSQTVVPVEQTSYHVPAFSNDYVTVLNVFIPPQRRSGYHHHSLDSLGVLISDTARTGQILGEAVEVTPPRPLGSVTFSFYSREDRIHDVHVTGNAPFHNIVVELLKPVPGEFTAGSRDGVSGYTQVLDNERVRAWRLVLGPGEQAAAITQRAPGLRIVVAGGELVERVPGQPDRGKAPRSGEFFWQDAGVTRAVQNVGTTRIEVVEIELK